MRLLHEGGEDLENYFEEIEPLIGTLVAFECVENAWHGHKPHIGIRRSMQVNWVKDSGYLGKEQTRHKFSALIKRLCCYISGKKTT